MDCLGIGRRTTLAKQSRFGVKGTFRLSHE